MPYYLVVDKTTVGLYAVRCAMHIHDSNVEKLDVCASALSLCLYHNQVSFMSVDFYDCDMNAMQIMCAEIPSSADHDAVFGCIISSHLLGLKNNQNDSLFCTWMDLSACKCVHVFLYLSIPFANII